MTSEQPMASDAIISKMTPSCHISPCRKNISVPAAAPTQANRPISHCGRGERSAIAPTKISRNAEISVVTVVT